MGARAAIVGGVAVCALLAGCTPGVPAEPPFTVTVVQPRTGIAMGIIAMQVKNTGETTIDVSSAELDSDYLGAPLVWEGDSVTLAPGRAVDLRVPLDTWDCDTDATADASATIGYSIEGGGSGTAIVSAPDPTIALPGLWEGACLAEGVAEVVDLRAIALESSGTVGAVGELVLSTEPTGADGTVEVHSVESTTLLAPFDGVSGVPTVPLDLVLGADGPPEVRIPFVPNRCDAHALAEDKIGTRIPLQVTVGELSGRLVLPATDELRAQMYAFYGDYCALP
ncbi:energy-converting hydrogenase Eha subunit A [Leifsonia sp. AK011]|uniref:hypothetical protein n=1 Tax=Leifsonia sp. AK011 TaxID=2723075 RepID=UPI0015CA5D72|nr:hypothetical protein [Leifsonia sp. AK011]NYF09448.1 energy-converting hydrogenase Eha subunit A [Leifsonia sp. AK011]